MCCHVPCNTGACLPAKVSSGAAMCQMDLNLASLIGRAPTPSRVPWLRTLPACKVGLRCTTCPTASDPASLQGRASERCVSCSSGSCLLQGRAPKRRVSYGSGSCLPTRRVSVPPLHTLRFSVDRGPQIYKERPS
jgi:hypothetical protein